MNLSFWKNKKVLITGNTGFKGSYLTLFLKKLGADIYGYSLKPNLGQSLFYDLNIDKMITEQNYANIKDINNMKSFFLKIKPDISFHFAAQPIVYESYKKPKNTFLVNVIGTINFLESIRDVECDSVVIATSDKCYLNNESQKSFNIDSPLGGKDPYSASKACAEIVTMAWRESFLKCPVSSVRAGNVIGGGDWSKNRILVDLATSYSRNKELYIRNPYSVRPWQHVYDSIIAYILIAQKQYKNSDNSKSWNVGPIKISKATVLDVVEIATKHWNKTYQNHLQKIKLYNASYSINRNLSFKESNYLHINSKETYKYLSIRPIFDYDQAIKKTIDWYIKYFFDIKNIKKYTDEDINSFLDKLKNE